MERLKVHQVQEIVHRLRSGQSERGIVRDLGCARDTVRRYARVARESGFLAETADLPTLAEIESACAEISVRRHSNVSTIEAFRPVVEALVMSGKEGVAIHRRLCKAYGFTGSYSAVRRFINQLKAPLIEPIVRIETGPGEQAQVDFGTVGKMWDPVTKRLRTAYCFVMTVCWSRHMYVRFVFDQQISTWLECHRLAFEAIGGVVEQIVIDNLKSAVIRASIVDPILGVPYTRFARHYGFLVHPCRPGTPEHKGKVESGVHYVKRNFIASEDLFDIQDANEKVARWVQEEAGIRCHGTTHEQPLVRFNAVEKALLRPLPELPFDLEAVVPAKLHRDCHVQVKGVYYSAPYRLIGKTLDVFLHHNSVQIFDGVLLVTTHERSRRRGTRITRPEHYPADKSLYMTRTRSWCRDRAYRIGPSCLKVVEQLLADGPLDRLRAIQGIVGLADRYSYERVDAACSRAAYYGDISCRRIKAILEAGTDQQPLAKSVQMQLTGYQFTRSASDFFTPEEATC
jgi:transposase